MGPHAHSPELVIERQGPVVRWMLNRPDKRNALSQSLLTRLAEASDTVSRDPAARVVVISGNGPAFCAGHDLGELTRMTSEQHHDIFALCARVMHGLRRLPQVVIAQVHGLATAAGCQLVAACDLAVAAEDAQFATPGVKIGLFCTTPMVPLVRAVTPKAALEMLLTGEPIGARRALELGLINRVTAADQLPDAVSALADSFVASSRSVVALGKAAFYELLPLNEMDAYERATCIIADNAGHRDAQEGMRAFLEKRTPVWAK